MEERIMNVWVNDLLDFDRTGRKANIGLKMLWMKLLFLTPI